MLGTPFIERNCRLEIVPGFFEVDKFRVARIDSVSGSKVEQVTAAGRC